MVFLVADGGADGAGVAGGGANELCVSARLQEEEEEEEAGSCWARVAY